MDDDEEWNLYQLMIGGDCSESEDTIQSSIEGADNVLDEFHCVEENSLRVSYSSLPVLMTSSVEKNNLDIPWYMDEVIYHKNTSAELKNEIFDENCSHSRATPIYLDSKDDQTSIESTEKVELVYIYSAMNEPPCEFVLVHNTQKPNEEEDYTFLGQLPTDVITNSQMVTAMKRYVELAKGAYATDEVQLRERAGLTEAQLFHADFQERSEAFPRPAFYLAVDESLQALILSIRGTKTALEFQIDAKWTPIEFPQLPGSYVHQGTGAISETLRLFPNHSVRVVGHSLGAGIAALFTLMIKEVIPSVKAVIFAPPACVSGNLLQICSECCVSFVNRNDILPYLTHANFASIFSSKRIVNITMNQPGNEPGDHDKLNSPAAVPIDIPLEDCNIIDDGHSKSAPQLSNNLTSKVCPDNSLIQFYPPGVLHHIFKSAGGTFHIREVGNDYFMNRGLSVSRTMIRHHKLDSYKHAFQEMIL